MGIGTTGSESQSSLRAEHPGYLRIFQLPEMYRNVGVKPLHCRICGSG
jgi:hypothetical protein